MKQAADYFSLSEADRAASATTSAGDGAIKFFNRKPLRLALYFKSSKETGKSN
jgi:hypothetical protein